MVGQSQGQSGDEAEVVIHRVAMGRQSCRAVGLRVGFQCVSIYLLNSINL